MENENTQKSSLLKRFLGRLAPSEKELQSYRLAKELTMKKMEKKKKSSTSRFMLGLLVIAFLRYYLTYLPRKTHVTIDNFSNIGDPIQIPTSGEIVKNINGVNMKITYLATYDIKGRVLATAQYGDNIFEKLFSSFSNIISFYSSDNVLRYKDVGIGRGFLTDDDIVKRFKWKSYYRFLFPEVKSRKDYSYINSKYSYSDINEHFSHNHLIPSNNHVKKLIRGIGKGDYVRIKGYLVSIQGDNGYQLTSSLTRSDMGNGACETIYVTDIVWLKEKKK